MDKNTSWLDHPVKVAVMVAVVGSIILVIGQLFGTLFPIWLGPDLSDYNLVFVCNPVCMCLALNSIHSV